MRYAHARVAAFCLMNMRRCSRRESGEAQGARALLLAARRMTERADVQEQLADLTADQHRLNLIVDRFVLMQQRCPLCPH